MKRIYNLYKIRKVVASIGVFDGVHRGHQRILKRLVEEATRQDAKSLVITFYPHPRQVLNPKTKIPFLTSLEHRLKLIETLGVDFLLIIKFTKTFSQITPGDFIKDILLGTLDIKTVIVGKNFIFGYKGTGDFSLLKKASRKYGFRLYGVKPIEMEGKPISSTRIRRAIEKGDLKNASLMLGRPVTILGAVVRGRKVGRKLGFPTANVDPYHEAIPPSGVYTVDARINKKLHKAILNIGTRPTFGKKNKQPTIEIHILNFKRDIYHKEIEIIFKRRIRKEKKFSSVRALREQIKKDILRAM